MNVVTFNPQSKLDEERKTELLEVIDALRSQIESGEVKELVACTLDKSGNTQIHVSVLDLPGGIGLYEIGKNLLMRLYE